MSEPKRNAPRPHRPGRGMVPTEKAKDFKGSFKKLISYLSPFKFKITHRRHFRGAFHRVHDRRPEDPRKSDR